MELKRGEKYLIEWNDTYSFQGWHDEEEIDKKTLTTTLQSTVGFFVKEDGPWLIFCTHHNPHPGYMEFGDPCWVPKDCIVKFKKL